jgi:hypothetical protein
MWSERDPLGEREPGELFTPQTAEAQVNTLASSSRCAAEPKLRARTDALIVVDVGRQERTSRCQLWAPVRPVLPGLRVTGPRVRAWVDISIQSRCSTPRIQVCAGA